MFRDLLTQIYNAFQWSLFQIESWGNFTLLFTIPEDVYSVTRENLDRQLDEIGIEIRDLENQSSNQDLDVASAITTICNLGDYWKNGTYETKQFIQDFAFPDGLHWDRENDNYRTTSENEALSLIRLFSSSYRNEISQKKDKTLVLSSLVAEAGLEPATSGL